jgi:acyl carrier protein
MGKVTDAEVRREVTTFIVDNFLFGNAAESPKPETSFLKTALIDSTGIVELADFLDGKFGVTVADNEFVPENLDSVANIAAFVVRKQGG